MSLRTRLLVFALALATPSAALAWEPNLVCGGDLGRWRVPEVPYRLNSAGSGDLPFTTVETAVANAWNAWSAPCCSAWRVRRDPDTTVTATEDSTQHVISFEEDNWDPSLGAVDTVIAVNLSSFGANCSITDGDIVFNGVGFVFVNGNPGAGNEADLQSIATHEQGHWLGLDHTNAGPTATMHDTYDNGIGARTLHPDDEQGVCTLYPQSEKNCGDGADDDCDGATDCLDADCAALPSCSCQPLASLSCGGVVNATTVGGATFLGSYGCGGSAPGPEIAYSIQPTFDGQITFALSGLTTNLNLFVIPNQCLPEGCVQQSVAAGTAADQITMNVTADNLYNVVVDSVTTGGPFTLTVTCAPTKERACANGADDDGDGAADCLDSDCAGETCAPAGAVCAGLTCVCPGGGAPETVCNDQSDNDCDGKVDCADSNCDGQPCGAGGQTCSLNSCVCAGGNQTESNCADGADDDCDGDIDCDDDDCLNESCGAHGVQCLVTAFGPTCICPTGASVEFLCGDAVDGDCDGLIDCDDPDCDNKSCGTDLACDGGSCVCAPSQSPELSCFDGKDNDCDTLIDCADPDCLLLGEVACHDGIDNDCDQLTDCDDPDCVGTSIESSCDNGTDDDCDLAVDCDDEDCEREPGCIPPESDCNNLVDDDADGATDCADSDCYGTPACPAPGDPEGPGGDPDGDPGPQPGDSDPPPGCGCQGSGPLDAGLLLGLMGWALRRRRRS